MAAIIDIQGFKDQCNKFLVKELAIVTNGGQMQHFVFQPPFRFKDLTPAKQSEVKWLHDNYHGFNWNDGYIPYHRLHTLVGPLIKDRVIFLKGNDKLQWVKETFGKSIIVYNMEGELQCPKLSYLQFLYNNNNYNNNVQRCLIHKGKCAQENVYLLKNFLDNNRNKY